MFKKEIFRAVNKKVILQVRTVKPGVYRHTITGLSPSTQYRVTVRAKHLRAGPPGMPIEEAPGAYTDFRTLPKGLPDPPIEIMVFIFNLF